MGFRRNQLSALLRKNLILTKRKFRDLLRELALPIILLGILMLLKSVVPNLPFEATMDYPEDATSLNDGGVYIPSAFLALNATPTVGVAPCSDSGVQNLATILQAGDEYSLFCGRMSYILPVSCWRLTYQCFNTTDELKAEATNHQTLYAGLTFAVPLLSTDSPHVSFQILMNSSIVNYPSDGNFAKDESPSIVPRTVFAQTGFMGFQNAVQSAYLSLKAGATAPKFSSKQMPNGAFVLNSGVSVMQTILPLYLAILFSVQIRTGLTAVLEEKENKLREGMLMMGLSPVMNNIGWFITFGCKNLILVLVLTLAAAFSLLPSSSFIVLLLYFSLFAIVSQAYTFLVATFFSTAKLGSMVGYLVYFVASLPVLFLAKQTIPAAAQYALCLIAPLGFSLGLTAFNNAEGAVANGVSFSNLMTPPPGSNISVGGVMLMLLLDAVIYAGLSWYTDQVIGSSFGAKKRCCFCFDRFKRGSRTGPQEPLMGKETPEHAADIEMVAGDAVPSVQIRGLKKGFVSPTVGEVNAVDRLSLDMYEGEITALLGHNGAGKTTTINVLTGMLPPTGGEATVFGHSITHDMSAIRKIIGVCPQHNILWSLLTVREHLELFGGLKGMDSVTATREAFIALEDVGLADKADALSSTLSGGMKRKLSVAMALLGDPRIVFLDEPTAGMDPQARRTMWDLLARHKKRRVIVLTTHYMDEADLLGDRIAIMSKGRLRVMGSSMFLKSKFGLGYHLVLELQNDSRDAQTAAEQIVSRHIQSWTKEPETANKAEARYLLPRVYVPHFAALFEEFDSRKELVRSYGLSQTTLEEVFVRLADETVVSNSTDANLAVSAEAKTFEVGALPVRMSVSSHSIQSKGLLNTARNAPAGERTFGRQMGSLIKKRMLIAKRDKKSLWFQCALPVVLMGVSAAFSSLQNITAGVASGIVISSSILDNKDIASRWPLEVRYSHAVGSPSASWIDQMPLPYAGVLSPIVKDDAASLDNFSQSLLTRCKGDCEAAVWTDSSTIIGLYNASYLASPPLLLNWVGTALLREAVNDPKADFEVTYTPFPRAAGEPMVDLGAIVYSGASALYASSGFITIGAISVVFVVKERISGAKHQQLLAGVSVSAYWMSTLVFDMIFFLVPVVGVMMMIQILGLTGLSSPLSNFATIFVVLMCFGPATLSLAYMISPLFTSPTTAQTVTLVGQSIAMIIFTVANIALLIALPGSPQIADAVNYIGYFIPNTALNTAMSKLAKAGALCAQYKEGPACEYNPFSWDMAGGPMAFLLSSFLIFFSITIFVEVRGRRPGKQGFSMYSQDLTHEDEDVAAERARVAADDSDNVRINSLHKMWPPRAKQPEKVAVQDFTLGIQKGTVFGLLGVNGAGKTTLLSMLTGVTHPTRGDATVAGYSILTDLEEIQKLLGFCPQFDALFDEMTGREHLELYAALKAIPRDQIPELVTALLQLLTLAEHSEKMSKEYSGGNKRKLSLAIALLGSPRVMMLDEPSAGMDPMARRAILEVVSFAVTGSDTSVILTTHLMEECEALANRIGIMVNGGLACIGSLQHLKARFGAFWQMELQVADEKNSQEAQDLVKSICPEAELLEWHRGHFLFKLPSAGTPLSKVYREIEAAKKHLSIVDYSVSQCSLEQIFLAFAKHQIEIEE